MQAQFESVRPDLGSSFLVTEISQPAFDGTWHFHPEFELTWIEEGKGQRLVGDHLELFSPGDLVLLGTNLPHFWRSVREPPSEIPRQALSRAIVIQFPASLFEGPDFGSIRALLNRAGGGIAYAPPDKAMRSRLRSIRESNGWNRFRLLLEILGTLEEAPATNSRLLTRPGLQGSDDLVQDRLNRALSFLFSQSSDPSLDLESVAQAAGMSRSAFCRFFSRNVGCGFSAFLNEVRIGIACEQLSSTGKPVAEIAFDAGFGTLSNFNRVFKLLRHQTPLSFRRDARAGRIVTSQPPKSGALDS